MRIKFWFSFLIIATLFTSVACGVATSENPVAAGQTSPASMATITVTTTTKPAEGTDWLTVEGKTEDDLTYLGNPAAPVTMIDYSDFLCVTCRAFALKIEPQLREKYIKTGQVKLVFSAIIDFGDSSLQAHQATLCAGEQGKFWPMYDLLFVQQSAINGGGVREALKSLAAQLPLDTQQFNACLDQQRTAPVAQSQDEHRRQLGIRTRPTFDLNGQLIVGPQPFEIFQNVIEPLLKP